MQAMKQLLEKTRVTAPLIEKIEEKITWGRAPSPVQVEQSSTLSTHHHSERNEARPGAKTCHSERSEAKPNGVEGPALSLDTVNDQLTTNDLSSALGQTLSQLLKRPEITVETLAPVLQALDPAFFHRNNSSVGKLSTEVRNELKSIETETKYEGYLLQQQRAIDRLKKAELRAIPDWFDYGAVSGLSREMQETLLKIRPHTLAHASRIPGVTPAAVSLVNVYIEIQSKRRQQAVVL
jgi:tRNA U34 5-carboxymethylaminomethyl modifying enzyme MnmG/GidA